MSDLLWIALIVVMGLLFWPILILGILFMDRIMWAWIDFRRWVGRSFGKLQRLAERVPGPKVWTYSTPRGKP